MRKINPIDGSKYSDFFYIWQVSHRNLFWEETGKLSQNASATHCPDIKVPQLEFGLAAHMAQHNPCSIADPLLLQPPLVTTISLISIRFTGFSVSPET